MSLPSARLAGRWLLFSHMLLWVTYAHDRRKGTAKSKWSSAFPDGCILNTLWLTLANSPVRVRERVCGVSALWQRRRHPGAEQWPGSRKNRGNHCQLPRGCRCCQACWRLPAWPCDLHSKAQPGKRHTVMSADWADHVIKPSWSLSPWRNKKKKLFIILFRHLETLLHSQSDFANNLILVFPF